MYSTEPQEIFFKGTHGVRRQDKKPPGRFEVGVSEPLTAAADPETAKNLQQNRQTHHGSETRQTANIAGRVPFHIKSEILRIGAMHGWKESYTVRTLVEQALAHSLGEKFAVMIRNTIQEAVKTELQKDREWLRKINLSEYLAAEQGRLLVIDFLRAFLPKGEDVNQKISESRKNSFKHLKFYFHSIGVQDQQSSWPSSK
jgi:predicted amidophosphoribosyltransferase